MKKSLKSLFYLGCGIIVLSLAGCGGSSNSPSSAEDIKAFKGGGPMSAEDAATAKNLMQGAQQAPGKPAAK